MEILLYITIFIIGLILGAFCNLAIEKISKNRNKQKTVQKATNNKFENILPLLTGLTSIGIFYSLKVNIENINIVNIIEYLYLMLFVVTLILIAGIDKKKKKIQKRLIFLGCIAGLAHMAYIYIIGNIGTFSVYKYIIYFSIICILSTITTKNPYFKYTYLIDIMSLCVYINMFVATEVFLITTILTMISLVATIIIKKTRNKIDNSDILAEKNNNNIDISFGMYICISNIIAMIIQGIEIINI